ncbi:MAG: hypothetical protein L3J43_09310 [Sulfurovum sp.]|nr:hypothetical protein [Sulfurovum sp.]
MMKYIHRILNLIKKIFVGIWNAFSIFFGFPYEEQAKKMKDYDARGEENPTRTYTAYRANKVVKKETK